jgi:hypothetical protein
MRQNELRAMTEADMALLEQEQTPQSAKEAYERKPYAATAQAASCAAYDQTECKRKICCFECLRRASCKEFDGYCGDDTKETYKTCPERQERNGGMETCF